MACLLALAVAATVLMAQPGQLASAARTSPAEAFWRAALPDAPMPDAIHELLHPGTAVRNGVTTAEATEDGGSKPPMNFNYDDYKGTSPRSEATNNAPSPDVLNRTGVRNGAADGDSAAASSTVFFLEDAVRVGESLPFPSTQRDVAAAAAAVAAGEASAGMPLRLYTVRSVRVVQGSSFVVCRVEGAGRGAADVYGCRPTAGPARAYVLALALAGERGDDAVMSAAAVCHTDTSRWDPAHAAFRLLGVKPGVAAAICYAVPNGQVLSAN